LSEGQKGNEIKTKYKTLNFKKSKKRRRPTWEIWHRLAGDIIGHIAGENSTGYCGTWWYVQFASSNERYLFTREMLLEIIDFMKQLNTKKKK